MRIRRFANVLAYVAGLAPAALFGAPFLRADANSDGAIDISDPVLTLSTLFVSEFPSPACLKPLDANDDGVVNLSDAVYSLTFLFRGGSAPPPPFPTCGEDPTDDAIAACQVPQPSCLARRRYERVVYWGQNGYGGSHPDRSTWEDSLAETCASGDYDVVVLGFVVMYFDPRNPGELPGLNFSYHCTDPFPGHVSLLRCPEIAADIRTCQDAGVKVLMSLGGAVGIYLFDGNVQARGFARTIWDMFLGGSSYDIPRPFDDVVLDGVNLDIEAGAHNYHSAFVEALHALMESESPGRYLMTAAPQCPYPDAHLGPAPGAALGDYPALFDHVYIQFYNNFCRYSATDASSFRNVLGRWHSWSASTDGPRIFVGLPAMAQAAPAGGYVPREELDGLVEVIRNFDRVGGFMLWDASFDQNSVDDGLKYSEALDTLLNKNTR